MKNCSRNWALALLVAVAAGAACGGAEEPQSSGSGGAGNAGGGPFSGSGGDVTGPGGSGDDGVPAIVPSSTACDGTPLWDSGGDYQVLRPEESQHIITSTHFAARWNDADNVPLADDEVQRRLQVLEDIWDFYMIEVGFQPPYAGEPVKYKVNVNVSDRGWATGSGTGDHDPAMWVHYDAFGDPGTVAHEFAHTLQFTARGLRNSRYVGWAWESHANWMSHEYLPDDVNCAEMLVNSPHLYYGSTRDRYCNWQFWEFLKDQYCYQVVNDIWSKSKKPEDEGYTDEDPFTALARNMEWTASDINDVFGVWAMHNVTWDYKNGEVYRERFGPYSDRRKDRRSRVTMLEALDREKGRFVVPAYWAPQRWGYNLVRLFPDAPKMDTTIEVDFRGVVQEAPASTDFEPFDLHPETIPAPGSDFRFGLVAVDESGAPRYGSLHRGADAHASFAVRASDKELWLVVTATPSSIQKILWDQMYYTIYRYPWMVEIHGARPEGFEEGAAAPPEGIAGAPHPNGGGFVAATAQVAPTAFVGPNARVLGRARVSDEARIEDFAVVDEDATVSDRAVVRGHAWVSEAGVVRGAAIVEDFAAIYRGEVYEDARVGALTVVDSPQAKIHGSARVAAIMNSVRERELSGTAQMLGDMELWTSLSRGVFYGFVTDTEAADARFGADRTEPRKEVTVQPPFSWR